MVAGVVGQEKLHHPYGPEGVEGDQGAIALNPHTVDPFYKAHPPDEMDDVGTSKYDPNSRINYLMMESEGGLIS